MMELAGARAHQLSAAMQMYARLGYAAWVIAGPMSTPSSRGAAFAAMAAFLRQLRNLTQGDMRCAGF